jgi:hypothetical protein|tara:strand:+ start:1041 stop:1316 length:276 start_codon:yes stop_codon:yes gene_type:complete
MLYRAINKSRNNQWIIADDETEALEIALKSKFIKSKGNCKLQTYDRYCEDFYKFFKEKGNDMTQVDTLKGVGCVHFKNAQDKGTWVVNSCW